MNTCYLGISGSGKTYLLKHFILDACSDHYSNQKDIYVIGRPEEWNCFQGINFFDVYSLDYEEIDKLQYVTNSIIVIDSTEFIENKDFLLPLLRTSKTLNNRVYISVLDIETFNKVFTNINTLYIGDLPKSWISYLNKEFGIQIDPDHNTKLTEKKFRNIMLGDTL